MKRYTFLLSFLILCLTTVRAQQKINDEALRYQEQRMVFQQWDQNKFKPSSGFLGLNPFYWLVWGFPYPNYHKTDLRPLRANGPQTVRLAAVAAMQTADSKYKMESDTVRNTAISQIASQSGLLSDADPLWLLYYKKQFDPVLNYSMASVLAGLTVPVQQKLISEGLCDWYINELDRLKERVKGAHDTDMDRGARIMAWYRLLLEYRNVSGVWAIRTASAKVTMDMTAQQQQLNNGNVRVSNWTPQSDIAIAQKVLQHIR
ncbi:hypothetical protein SAMN05192574_105307 [Mucilaginibacter gossypiicola]|uniref:DUF5045 domain-containing protein n=1 Tax=Mucilaginibacter gossypiicola TaxID=551995 RepID=A0A1H8LYG0_9SPHI|nr:hypothetical protein [Mucilaginibacter gossypiicola]SEO10182.1 hypothetical protein SAMN05192574_105307 [Mucilaginibacter gossypiicola]